MFYLFLFDSNLNVRNYVLDIRAVELYLTKIFMTGILRTVDKLIDFCIKKYGFNGLKLSDVGSQRAIDKLHTNKAMQMVRNDGMGVVWYMLNPSPDLLD